MTTKYHLRNGFYTDAGMLAIWDHKAFQGIHDYETWEKELLEDADIEKHIRAGHYVPININSDGVFHCGVRVGAKGTPAVLTAREQSFLTPTSEPYLLNTTGTIVMGGIEHVEAEPQADVTDKLDIPAGRYGVVVHGMRWQEEEGAEDDQGNVSPNALPVFVVLINPVDDDDGPFRTLVNTFS